MDARFDEIEELGSGYAADVEGNRKDRFIRRNHEKEITWQNKKGGSHVEPKGYRLPCKREEK